MHDMDSWWLNVLTILYDPTAATFSVHNMFTATNLVSSEQRFFSSEHVYSLDTLDAWHG